LLAVVMAPAASFAQDSHWGVVGSVTPQWKVPSQLENLFDGTVDIKGTDFTIGIARGRVLSGDWGVSFIHKKLSDGSRVEKIEQRCFPVGSTTTCFPDGESIVTRGVTLNGVEVHKYVSFGTIRQRVQIGMNFAGGVGTFHGDLDERELRAEPIAFDPRTGQPTGFRSVETLETKPASDLIDVSTVPLLKIQPAVSFIAAPGFKVRVQGGLNLPGYEVFSVVGVVFFGAK